jgi:hypothetical protein
MDSKKKSTCNCFSFLLRRNRQHSQAVPSSSSLRPNPPVPIKVVPISSEGSFRADRSLSSASQKLSGASNNVRSSIVTPSRRTAQMQHLIRSVFTCSLNHVKPEGNHSVETGVSRPATFRENPTVLELPRLNNILAGLDQDCETHIEQAEDRKNECIVEEKYCDSEEMGRREEEKSGFWVKSPEMTISVLSKSSNFSMMGKLESFEMSPIRCVAVVEGDSEILSLLNNSEKMRNIPDMFIRAQKGSRNLPVLKPITPCFFAKKRIFPVVRN